MTNHKISKSQVAALAQANCGIPKNDVRYIRPNGYNHAEIYGITRSYELNKQYDKTTNYK